jgi:hypothetical protein
VAESKEVAKANGIWKKHFHWRVLLGWEVLGWILFAFLTVAGLLLVFDQYTGANVCFMLTALFLVAKITHVSVSSVGDPLWHRLLFTFVLFGLVGVGIVEAVRGVNSWRAKHGTGESTTTSTSSSAGEQQPITKSQPAEAPALELAPAGFISFIGQVLNGYAPMMQENQTDTPLDDVHLSIIESAPNSEAPSNENEWGAGTVVWQKEIDIGTCRARLTKDLPERFPVAGQKRLFFHILMMTRFQSYRETIKLTRTREQEYSAELSFYGSGANPIYTRNMNIGIVTPRSDSPRPSVSGKGTVTPQLGDSAPPTLKDLFNRDFPNTMKAADDIGIEWKTGETLEIRRQLYLDFPAKTKFVGFYVPAPDPLVDAKTIEACVKLADAVQQALDDIPKKVAVSGGYRGEMTSIQQLTFSGRVLIYHDAFLSITQKADIIHVYADRQFDVQFRGPDYLGDQVVAWHQQHDLNHGTKPQ